MKMSALGAACSSFAIVMAEMTGMILDNGTLTASHAISAISSPALAASGNTRYAQSVEITGEPDALGRVPVRAGQVLLVPRISGSGFLQFLDPSTGVITTTSLAIPGYSAGVSQFSCAVTLPNGIIQLVPWQNTAICHYDPYADTLVAAVTHGRASTSTIPAFAGACVSKDDIAWYTPGYPTDKCLCKYDYVTGTFSVTSIALPYHTDWQTTNNGSAVIPLPDGDLLVLTARAVALNAPWRIKPSTGAITNATLTGTTTTSSVMLGGVLAADGKHVVLCEQIGNKVRVYRLADNWLIDAVSFSSLPANPWTAVTMLPDGKIGFIGNGFTGMGIFDAGVPGTPGTFKMTLGSVAATGILTVTGNFSDGETVTIGSLAYTFKTTVSTTARQVLIGATAADSLANLAAALNLSAGSGSTYGSATSANADVSGAVATSTTLTVTAATLGTAGNSVATTDTAANASWGAATMGSGGGTVGVNIGSTAGISGVASGSGVNTVGGRSLASGKVLILPGSNITSFLTWQPYTTGAVAEGVRKSRYFDRK